MAVDLSDFEPADATTSVDWKDFEPVPDAFAPFTGRGVTSPPTIQNPVPILPQVTPKPAPDLDTRFQMDFTPQPSLQAPVGGRPSPAPVPIPGVTDLQDRIQSGVETGLTGLANKLITAKNLLTQGETNAFPPTPLLQPGQSLVPKSISQPLKEFAPQALDAITQSGKSDRAAIAKLMEGDEFLNRPPMSREDAVAYLQNTPAAEGITAAAVKAGKGFTTLSGIATLPLFEYPIVRALFAASGIGQTPAAVERLTTVLSDPKASASQKWESGGDFLNHLATTAAMTLSLGGHEPVTAAQVKAKYTPEEAAKIAETKTSEPTPAVPVTHSESPQPEVAKAPAAPVASAPPVADKAGRLEQLKAVENPTPEQMTERDALDKEQKSNNSREAFLKVNGGKLPEKPIEIDLRKTIPSELQNHTTPIVDQTVNKTDTPTQRYKIGKSPQTYTVEERLPQSDAEKMVGEQAVRVKNEKTGETQVVLEDDLTPVKTLTPEEKSGAPKRDLDAELKASKLDPDSFQNNAQKREALRRANAIDPKLRDKMDAALQKLKVKTQGTTQFFGLVPEVWNTAIDIVRTGIKAGLSVTDAVAKAFDHIRANHQGDFDEEGATNSLVSAFRKEGEGGNADTYGIAARVREERAKSGQVKDIPSGEGIGAEESVEHGRELLESGVDPEKELQEFERTKKFSAETIAVVRARGEQLSKAANEAESQFGTNSEQYQSAWKALSDWDARTKEIQTEWHRGGQAQQGQTDIDTGTFTGLQRQFKEDTGKEFTPNQEGTAKGIAKRQKKAESEFDAADSKLNDHLDKQSGGTDAEKRALKAVNRQHRENAIRLANAEKKRELAKTDDQRAKAKFEEDAARKALDASKKVVDAAAERLRKAQAEADAKAKVNHQRGEEQKAADAALEAANKQRRDAAVKLAEAEKKSQEAKSAAEKKTAIAERKAAQKLVDLANKRRRDAAVKAAQLEARNLANPDIHVWNKVREYLDKGVEGFDNIISKISTDLGMSFKKVAQILSKDKTARRLADDAWRKQQDLRRLKQQAKIWLLSQSTPSLLKLPQAILREAFNLKVLGHLSVGLGTHAPMVFFQPKYWGQYFKNYGNMWRIGLSKAAHEMMMQDLQRRPNWTTARRAGLENDPFAYNEYQLTGLVEKLFPNLSHGGNRAYDALKLLRQDMFDKQWNVLPEGLQTPEMASAISDSVNHVTGIVKKSPFGKVSGALFAPRLLASRFAWAFGDPAKAAITGARTLTDIVKGEKTSTDAEKAFAVNQVREKATVVATMGAMLAANAALLSLSGSKQKINFTDPTRSDWLKFKAAGLDISYGNAMLTTLRLPVREAAILWHNTKFASHSSHRFEAADRATSAAIWEYMRNQLNPALADVTDVAFQNDSQGRPLPWNKQQVPPAYLRRRGVTKAYTWSEWIRDTAMPISLEESVKQIFNDYGMPKDQVDKWTKIIGTAIFMGGTGGRISEDGYKDSK